MTHPPPRIHCPGYWHPLECQAVESEQVMLRRGIVVWILQCQAGVTAQLMRLTMGLARHMARLQGPQVSLQSDLTRTRCLS